MNLSAADKEQFARDVIAAVVPSKVRSRGLQCVDVCDERVSHLQVVV